jgi:molybdopterin/thiamine biosynthesis adenylyltransferase
LLDDIGIEGQERLLSAQALIIGAGGLGSPAALYLAAAGVNLTLCDDDDVDLTNLQRQILHTTPHIGMAKIDSAKKSLTALNPHCHVEIVNERLNKKNAAHLIIAADVVLDCSDNYATRHLINRCCTKYSKPLVFGAAIGFTGQMTVFDSRNAQSPCYNCLFSENDEAVETRCALMGVLAPLTGIIGCLQATETVKLIAAPHTSSLAGRLLLVDARDMCWREVQVPRDTECEVCCVRA